MTYNVLGIRAVDDPFDPLYPALIQKARGIYLYGASDGLNVIQFPFVALAVYEQGREEALGSFIGRNGALFLTDSRVVLHNHQFETGKMIDAFFGLQAEYLASSLLARARTHNRALVGHVPHMCLQRISVRVPAKRGQQPKISLTVHERTGEARREIRVVVSLRANEDPVALGEQILRRYGTYWLANAARLGAHLSDQARNRLSALSAGGVGFKAVAGEWVGVAMPASVSLQPEKFRRIGISEPTKQL